MLHAGLWDMLADPDLVGPDYEVDPTPGHELLARLTLEDARWVGGAPSCLVTLPALARLSRSLLDCLHECSGYIRYPGHAWLERSLAAPHTHAGCPARCGCTRCATCWPTSRVLGARRTWRSSCR